MRKTRHKKTRDFRLKPILKWSLFAIFIIFILGAFYFTFRLTTTYKTLKFSQVYLFLHSKNSNEAVLDSALIKSAVLGQTHQLVYLPSMSFSMSSEPDLEAIKISASNQLKLPVDKVVLLTQEPTHKLNLIYQVLFYHDKNSDFFSHLAEKIDLISHLTTAETVEQVDLQTDELSNLFLERSLVQSNQACSIAVINTTDINGLASRISKLLERNGAYIVRTSSNDQDLVKSLVMVDTTKRDCQAIAKKLEALLPYHDEMQFQDNVIQDYRADVVIFLGDNLADFKF